MIEKEPMSHQRLNKEETWTEKQRGCCPHSGNAGCQAIPYSSCPMLTTLFSVLHLWRSCHPRTEKVLGLQNSSPYPLIAIKIGYSVVRGSANHRSQSTLRLHSTLRPQAGDG